MNIGEIVTRVRPDVEQLPPVAIVVVCASCGGVVVRGDCGRRHAPGSAQMMLKVTEGRRA